jgi:hypothetical protein
MWKEWLKIELLRKFLKESQEEEDCRGGQGKDDWTMLRRTSGRWVLEDEEVGLRIEKSGL